MGFGAQESTAGPSRLPEDPAFPMDASSQEHDAQGLQDFLNEWMRYMEEVSGQAGPSGTVFDPATGGGDLGPVQPHSGDAFDLRAFEMEFAGFTEEHFSPLVADLFTHVSDLGLDTDIGASGS